MSDEFEVRHFDNRIQPGSDKPHQQRIPNEEEPIAISSYNEGQPGYNPQQSDSGRMAAYQANSPTGNTPPASADYQSPSRGRPDQIQHGTGHGHQQKQMEEPRQQQQKQQQQITIGPKIDPDDLENDDDEEGSVGVCGSILYFLCILIVIFTFPLSMCVCVKVVQEYERAVMFRLGRVLPGVKGPGMFLVFPCIEEFIKIDLRTLSFDVPPQEILTKDSVTVAVDAVVYYRISKPKTSVIKVANAYQSTLLLAQTSLRNILGTKELRQVLADRDQIVEQMLRLVDEGTDPWGVKVERVEIKDVRLPSMLQRAMAKEAEAQREAQAKVIAAEGEMMASKALREAALIIGENPSALQLRYLQTLGSIAAEKQSTILFPLPINGLASGGKKHL